MKACAVHRVPSLYKSLSATLDKQFTLTELGFPYVLWGPNKSSSLIHVLHVVNDKEHTNNAYSIEPW